MEKKKRRVFTESSSLASSSTSGSSTYRNPTFQPQSKPFDKPDHPPPTHLFQTGPEDDPIVYVHDPKYSASTPDLTSASPYYGIQNSNNSHSVLRQRPLPLSGPDKHPSAQAYANIAFAGAMECEQDSDTGECQSTKPPRLSMKLAYGDYDLTDQLDATPVESAFYSPRNDDTPRRFDYEAPSAESGHMTVTNIEDYRNDVPL